MPTRHSYPEGVPCWTDLAATDVDAAATFYSALFGWELEKVETGTTPYRMALQKGLPAAGIGAAPDEQPFSVWTTYFAVDDADAAVDRAKEAGGTALVEPFDVTDAGRMAILSDPTGAMFGIWQAGTHFGAAIVNEHGGLNWNELISDDLPTALPFYERMLGFTHKTSQGLSGPYTTLSIGDRAVAGAMPPPAEGIPNNWGVYFAVENATDAMEAARENGGQILFGPMEIAEVGTFVGITDPTGANFTVIELATAID